MKKMILCILSVGPITYCMEHKHTEKHSLKTSDSGLQYGSSSTTQLTRSKSQKNPVRSHAQLTQGVKDITSKHRQKLADSSCSTSEKKG